ncbi:MAG TPA: alpha-2-macroglobulin family protein, partial [Chitinophagaceae bacterium]|nr:alpha-2-macroglobulin family protein [Chitinophagaceae bacterium]
DKKAESLLVKLNDYASAAGTFKLPQSLLTGQFNLSVERYDGYVSFNVEEYKRPKFYVEFDTIKSSYRLNDTIHISGFAKAYSGNNIDGATVKFSVQRKARFIYPWLTWRFPERGGSNKQITQGTAKTDANGKFEIIFTAEPDAGIDKKTEPVFDYSIEVSVTDISGETREGSNNISIGYKSLQLQLDVPELAEIKDFEEIGISAKNMNGANVPAAVSIKIYPLQAPNKLFRSRYWQQPDQHILSRDEYEKYFPYDVYADEDDYHSWQRMNAVVADSIHTSATSNFKLQTSNFQQGWYAIEATATDKDGNEVKNIKYVQLFDAASKELPVPQMNWQYAIKDKVLKGETAKLAIGTAEKNVFVIQNIETRDKLVYNVADIKKPETQYAYFTISNNKKIIEYKINDEDKAVGLFYAFVKHNRIYTGGTNITVLHPERELNIGFASFRNKTEPGSKETYTITVKGNNGEKVTAELLTGMYDASLDEFRGHSWSAPYPWNSYFVNNYWNGNNCFRKGNSRENYLNYPSISYDKTYLSLAKNMDDLLIKEHEATLEDINRFGGDINKMRKAGYYITEVNEVKAGYIMRENEYAAKLPMPGRISIRKYTAPKIVADEISATIADTSAVLDVNGNPLSMRYVNIPSEKKQNLNNIQPRRNFNETAFFFPQLYADTAGNYSFSFTMPEALTKWKWMALAHTKDLAFSDNEQTIITQKKLMVQPGLPRFVREGDVMEFSAKISNLSDSEFTGTVTMQLTDAATNQPVDASFSNALPQQYFTAAAGQSTVVKFPVNIPFSADKPVTVKIIAQATTLSDGEENTLPVLTNRTLVTETLPIFIRHDTVQQFRFEKLLQNNSATLQHNSLTVEFTSNPIWYAVQSLPY